MRACWLVLVLLLPGCLAPVPEGGTRSSSVATMPVVTSPRWQAFEEAERLACPQDGQRAVSCKEAWVSEASAPSEPPPYGPEWRVGELERVTWGVDAPGMPALPGWTLALVVPEGWEVVDGPTRHEGGLPAGGVRMVTTLRAVAPGEWRVLLDARENGHASPSRGLNLRVAEG